MKHYGVRFYRGRVGADGNSGTVSEILLSLYQAAQINGNSIPQWDAGSCKYELRDLVPFNDGASFKGVLAVLRDDAPHIRGADGVERDIPLDVNEHVIEKNHFLFFRENELLVWQVNGRASHISRLEQYVTMLAPATVTFDDIINSSALARLEHGTVKRFRLRVAKPRNAAAVNPENWEDGAFELMNGIDGTTLQVEIATRRKAKGLSGSVKAAIHRLLDRGETRALEVRLEGDKEPIDLFADCIRDKMHVDMNGMYPFPESIFAELSAAKDRQQATLDDFFGIGDAVLE